MRSTLNDVRREVMLLTVPQVQQTTNLSRTTVYSLIRSGELPAVRIGRSVRIPRTALEAWIEQRTR